MAPNWIRTAKVLPKSSSSNPKNRCTSKRCPVEDTGRNSVKPSTTPRTNALRKSNNMPGLQRQGCRDKDGEQDRRRRRRPLFPQDYPQGNGQKATLQTLLGKKLSAHGSTQSRYITCVASLRRGCHN